MVKSNKSAKRTTRSAKQVNEPLADTERDLPQKERIDLTKNNSRALRQSNSDIKNRLKQPNQPTNLAVSPSNLVDKQNQDAHMVLRSSPTRRDLSVLVRRSEQAEEDGYDTEGECGPFLLHQQEDTNEFVETSLPINQEQEEQPARSLDPNQCQTASSLIQTPEGKEDIDIDKIVQQEGLIKQNVQWIHQELQLRCLPTQGNKKELIWRLAKAINDKIKRFETLEEAKKTKKKNKHKK